MTYQERLEIEAENMAKAFYEIENGIDTWNIFVKSEEKYPNTNMANRAIENMFSLASIALELAAIEVRQAQHWNDDIEHYLQSQGLINTK